MAIGGIDFGTRMSSLESKIGNTDLREKSEISRGTETTGSESGNSVTFGDFLSKMVQEANQSQLTADQKLQDVAVGRNKDLHGAMIAMEKADINFKLLTQVRNKVIDAYREIMRMQV